jgi:hypothetical protein
MPKLQTPFVETEALLALMNEDRDRVVRLISAMYPNERKELEGFCMRLATWCENMRNEPTVEYRDSD